MLDHEVLNRGKALAKEVKANEEKLVIQDLTHESMFESDSHPSCSAYRGTYVPEIFVEVEVEDCEISDSLSDNQIKIWSVDGCSLEIVKRRSWKQNESVVREKLEEMKKDLETAQIRFQELFPDANDDTLTTVGQYHYAMINDIDEDLAACWFNVKHMDTVITRFHDGKNSFVYREPKLNTVDKCSKQFSSSSNDKQSAMESYIMLGMNRMVVNLLQNTVDPVITVDDGNLDMVFNSYITDNCFVNPFTNLIDTGRHQNFNMTTGNNYIPRNSVLYVSSNDGLTEGEFAYDSVNNYSGSDLVSKIIGRATRTTEINAAYQDFYKSMRGWASSDPTLTCLLAREVAGNFEFSQSPRLGVMLAVLHHYVMCN